MPYIKTTTNVSITPDKEKAIKDQLGAAISLLPGKNENWLMLSFIPETKMYFRGNSNEKLAIAEISLFGGANRNAYDNLTAKVTEILSNELEILPSGIYIKYTECSVWGWNGANF